MTNQEKALALINNFKRRRDHEVGEAQAVHELQDRIETALDEAGGHDEVARLAATVAAGTEAGVQLTPAPPDGREQWGSAEDVARHAVAIARAILAEVRVEVA